MALIDALYALLVIASCAVVVWRTQPLIRLTGHQGIAAFRDAFLFFGLTFAVRTVVTFVPLLGLPAALSSPILVTLQVLLYYALAMGGFMLVYSLLWRRLGRRIGILHAVSLLLGLFTVLESATMLYVALLGTLLYGLTVSYANYKEAPGHPFRQYYVIALALAFIGFLVNFLAEFLLPRSASILWFVYAATSAVFVIFAIGVLLVTWPRNENAST